MREIIRMNRNPPYDIIAAILFFSLTLGLTIIFRLNCCISLKQVLATVSSPTEFARLNMLQIALKRLETAAGTSSG